MAFIENAEEDEPQTNNGEGFLGADAAEQNGQFDQPNQTPPNSESGKSNPGGRHGCRAPPATAYR